QNAIDAFHFSRLLIFPSGHNQSKITVLFPKTKRGAPGAGGWCTLIVRRGISPNSDRPLDAQEKHPSLVVLVMIGVQVWQSRNRKKLLAFKNTVSILEKYWDVRHRRIFRSERQC